LRQASDHDVDQRRSRLIESACGKIDAGAPILWTVSATAPTMPGRALMLPISPIDVTGVTAWI